MNDGRSIGVSSLIGTFTPPKWMKKKNIKMEEIEQKAKVFLENYQISKKSKSIEQILEEVFIEGALSVQPKWKEFTSTSPLVDGCQYLVKKDRWQGWFEICTWNEAYKCWDDEDGDGVKYESVDLYLEIPG